MFSKVIRKKVFADSEEGYFSYIELEGLDKSEPLVFFHATGLNCETYLDLLEKIPFNPLPQYSNEEFSTDTEKDISLFSIAILFSSKKFIN